LLTFAVLLPWLSAHHRTATPPHCQAGLHRAAHFYRYYAERPVDEGFVEPIGGTGKPVDPLVAGRLPDGGATEMLLRELERRADGKRAEACGETRAIPALGGALPPTTHLAVAHATLLAVAAPSPDRFAAVEASEPHFYLRFQYCGKAESAKEIGALERALAKAKKGSKAATIAERGLVLYREKWISRRRRRRR